MPIQIGQPVDHGFDEPLGLLSDCHRRILRFLRVLVVTSEHAASAASPGQRKDLEAALRYFKVAAPMHTADEEESLFPRLRRAGGPGAEVAQTLMTRLADEHGDADAHHAAVDGLVRRWLEHGGLEPEEAGRLRAHLQSLEAIYAEHIRLEDRSLFPEAARLLSPDDLREMGREMAARRGVSGSQG